VRRVSGEGHRRKESRAARDHWVDVVKATLGELTVEASSR
jgi:hypothetical protein